MSGRKEAVSPEAGGKVEVEFGVTAIVLTVTGALSPGATGVTLQRSEAEKVVKALTQALAKLRTAEARPSGAGSFDEALKR
jgi:hypothetical protein